MSYTNTTTVQDAPVSAICSNKIQLPNRRASQPGSPITTPMMQTEEQLVTAAQKGDQSALGQLLENYQNQLFNVALRMVSNRDDAAEITQDAMMKVVQHIASYDGRSKLRRPRRRTRARPRGHGPWGCDPR